MITEFLPTYSIYRFVATSDLRATYREKPETTPTLFVIMTTTYIRFSTLWKSAARSCMASLSLLALLANLCVTSWGQSVRPAMNQRAAGQRSIRIMPPDGSAFLVEQQFDIRAEAPPGASGPLRLSLDGRDITEWNNRSHLGGQVVSDPSPALDSAPVFLSRDWSFPNTGPHTLRATIEGAAPREVSFEIVPWQGAGPKVRNVILLIGDGMGLAHRTAARIVSRGLFEGRYRNGMLEMDQMQATGLVTTSSLSALVTDSAPGASCYATGNKAANHQEGVFPDNTDTDAFKVADPESDRFFDNPKVENISEYLRRMRGMNLGLVTTADVTDATPAAFAVHTSNRNASTRIADDYFERRNQTGLTVLMGGGRQWFDTRAAKGQKGRRGTATNAKVNPARNLVQEFRNVGFAFANTAESLRSVGVSNHQGILGLFAAETMPTAFDKLGHGAERSPNVPMLDDMARVAVSTLSSLSPRGFFLMIEGGSIDKEAHREDADRAIWETIEFDRAVGVAKQFAERTNSDTDPDNDTLVIVTADHETSGFSIIGARNPDPRIPRGSRDSARAYRGFTDYKDDDGDGYPDEVDPPSKLIVGFGAGTDHYEDWISNKRHSPPTIKRGRRTVANPRRDGPLDPDPASRHGTLITGQVENGEAASIALDLDIDPMIHAVHTATDIPLTATGPGAMQFVGVQDNTSVFFKIMRAYGGSYPRVYYDGPQNIPASQR
jgi:alkaline phosphatase